MYFLFQLKNQFIAHIRAAEMSSGWAYSGGELIDIPTGQEDFSMDQLHNMTDSEILRELKERLESLKAAESIVWPQAKTLLRFCRKIQEEWVPEDEKKDFAITAGIALRLVERYQKLAEEWHDIQGDIQMELSQISSTVDREILAKEDPAIYRALEEQETWEEKLNKLKIQKNSYKGIFREKLSQFTQEEQRRFSQETQELISQIQFILEQEVLWDGKQEIIRWYKEWNEQIIWLFEKIDKKFEQERLLIDYSLQEKIYSKEDLWELREKVSEESQWFRKILFTDILKEKDTGKNVSEYRNHPNIQALQRENSEGYPFGYDIIDIMTDFDNVEVPEVWEDTQVEWSFLEYAQIRYSQLSLIIKIIARDFQKKEWSEKTFGERRLEFTHEAYKKLLENPEIKELLTNADGSIPLFEDLWMDHIKLLRDKGVSLTGLFLIYSSWENFEEWLLEEGKSYIINFSGNQDFHNNMDFSFIDSSAKQIEIDGKLVSFIESGTRWAGYYDTQGRQVLLQDGSEIKIISLQQENTSESIITRDKAISDRLKDLAEMTTEQRSFVEAVYRNPWDAFRGEKLPWGLVGAFIAMLLNFFDGRNFKYNAEKGIWEDIPEWEWSGTALTNGEVVSAYLWSMDLWSLSAEFESSSQGPYAYNPNDNGHGPSYGTYQMNSGVWVYKSFIQKYAITEWKNGWDAAIKKYGVEEFQKMEHQHIKENNYDPMMARITVPNKENFSLAMQNVIWSIGVQHGPAHPGLLAVINNSWVIPGEKMSEASLINALYDKRWRVYPAGITSRYNRERVKALSMLNSIFSENIYTQNLGEIAGGIKSFPVERSSSGTPLCSRTARKNLWILGLTDINGWSSARSAFEKYPSEKIVEFPPIWKSNAKVADLFLDASPENRQYGHRAAAFQQDGKWYVLDPYYLMGRNEWERQNPIPAEEYINYMKSTLWKRIWWAAYFS